MEGSTDAQVILEFHDYILAHKGLEKGVEELLEKREELSHEKGQGGGGTVTVF